jgi:chromosome partitioning protein
LELLFSTIGQVKNNLNPKLDIAGALITMFDSRIKFHREVVELIEQTYEKYFKVFKTKIPVSVKTTESQARSVSIFEHNPAGKVANAYEKFARELLGEA